jgi:hypothetical protein
MAAQSTAPAPIAAHPAFYPSQRQLSAWLYAGYNAFTSGEAHDDVFGIWGVDRWYWLPAEVIPVGADAALAGVSCETPQLLATYAAWRGTRSALSETRTCEAVCSQLAEQAGYCRFLVVGLTKSPAESLGLEYVLRVNGLRYGEPRVSSSYGRAFTVPSASTDSRNYVYVSVEVMEQYDIEYEAEVEGKTYQRAEIQTSVGYKRTTTVSVVRRSQPSPCRYLVSEIVDFPLLRDDGAPVIPADASMITLEALAPSASYEVSVSLTKDHSYLRDEPPMTNPMAAVTMTAGQKPRITTAPSPRTPVVIRLEDALKGPEFKGQQVTVCQRDAKIPLVLVSFPSELKPSELRAAVRRLVEEGQRALADGELRIVADVRGRQVMEGRYSVAAKRAVLRVLP